MFKVLFITGFSFILSQSQSFQPALSSRLSPINKIISNKEGGLKCSCDNLQVRKGPSSKGHLAREEDSSSSDNGQFQKQDSTQYRQQLQHRILQHYQLVTQREQQQEHRRQQDYNLGIQYIHQRLNEQRQRKQQNEQQRMQEYQRCLQRQQQQNQFKLQDIHLKIQKAKCSQQKQRLQREYQEQSLKNQNEIQKMQQQQQRRQQQYHRIIHNDNKQFNEDVQRFQKQQQRRQQLYHSYVQKQQQQAQIRQQNLCRQSQQIIAWRQYRKNRREQYLRRRRIFHQHLQQEQKLYQLFLHELEDEKNECGNNNQRIKEVEKLQQILKQQYQKHRKQQLLIDQKMRQDHAQLYC